MLKRRRGQNASINPALEHIEVDADILRASLTCELCKNILREANTVTECLHSFCFQCISSKMIVGQSNYCPACGSSDSSLGVNPFLDKKIITDGRKNHLCQTFREMLEKEVLVVEDGKGEKEGGEKEGEKKGEEQASMEQA
ncbi:unnamed protein product [Bathycoccus prasinos]